MRYLILIFLFFPLFFWGCSSGKEVAKNGKSLSIKEMINEINNNSARVQTLIAEGNISIETSKEANSGSFLMVLKKPDSLNIKINGPFGINAAKASFNRKTFRFYNAFENYLIKGETSEKAFSEILNIKMSFEEILSILSCTPDFYREDFLTPADSGKEENETTIAFNKDQEIIKYWINTENKYISKRCVLSNRGKLIREERYQNYIKIEKLWIPKSIQVILHQEKQSLTLYYSEHKINSGKLDFSFNVPDGIKVIEWK